MDTNEEDEVLRGSLKYGLTPENMPKSSATAIASKKNSQLIEMQ